MSTHNIFFVGEREKYYLIPLLSRRMNTVILWNAKSYLGLHCWHTALKCEHLLSIQQLLWLRIIARSIRVSRKLFFLILDQNIHVCCGYLLEAPQRGTSNEYGKCPKILHTKVADKMSYANSIDPDQTAPKGTVLSGSILFANVF